MGVPRKITASVKKEKKAPKPRQLKDISEVEDGSIIETEHIPQAIPNYNGKPLIEYIEETITKRMISIRPPEKVIDVSDFVQWVQTLRPDDHPMSRGIITRLKNHKRKSFITDVLYLVIEYQKRGVNHEKTNLS